MYPSVYPTSSPFSAFMPKQVCAPFRPPPFTLPSHLPSSSLTSVRPTSSSPSTFPFPNTHTPALPPPSPPSPPLRPHLPSSSLTSVRPTSNSLRVRWRSGMTLRIAKMRYRCRDAATSLRDRGAPRAVRPARDVNRVLRSGIPGSAAETQPPACGTGAHHEPSDLKAVQHEALQTPAPAGLPWAP